MTHVCSGSSGGPQRGRRMRALASACHGGGFCPARKHDIFAATSRQRRPDFAAGSPALGGNDGEAAVALAVEQATQVIAAINCAAWPSPRKNAGDQTLQLGVVARVRAGKYRDREERRQGEEVALAGERRKLFAVAALGPREPFAADLPTSGVTETATRPRRRPRRRCTRELGPRAPTAQHPLRNSCARRRWTRPPRSALARRSSRL